MTRLDKKFDRTFNQTLSHTHRISRARLPTRFLSDEYTHQSTGNLKMPSLAEADIRSQSFELGACEKAHDMRTSVISMRHDDLQGNAG